MKKYILTILAAALVAAGCSKSDKLFEPVELGVKSKTFTVACVAGQCSLEVLSDGEFTASLDPSDTWVSFIGKTERSITLSGDCLVDLSVELNRGLERRALVTLKRGSKTLQVTLVQSGVLSSDLSFASHSISAYAPACSLSAKFLSLLKDDELSISVEYDGEAQNWISDVVKENNFIKFNVLENELPDTRVARIVVTSVSDPSLGDALQVVQLGKDSEITETDFAGVRALLTEAGSLIIEDDLVIAGRNTGDNSQGNGGENVNVSASVQDLTRGGRTAYIQDENGEFGFRVLFDSEEDNILARFEKVTFDLKGTTLIRKGGEYNDPVRYEIEGARASNIIQTAEGSIYDLPVKEKNIIDLTDADVYTYVTLKDCEIPVRKGPFMPIDLRHNFIIHSYPMVLRDILGSNTYIMTNTTASWQRDGKGIPQGSGNVSGVIVHETCDNFEWDNDKSAAMASEGRMTDYITGIGNIGSYQIRPFTRSEIDLAESFEEGFSEMIMEIRYYSTSASNPIVQNALSSGGAVTVYPTYPEAENPLLDPAVNGKLRVLTFTEGGGVQTATAGNLSVFRDWTHLGPMADGVITDPARGNGVTDVHGVRSEWEPYSSVATNALIMKSSGWYSSNGWSTSKAWVASFSTEDLTIDNAPLSVQFGCCNGLGRTVGAARYWDVEYSADGSEWLFAGSYTCPDFPILSNRKPWQCPGYKYVSVTLPFDSAMFGQTEVYVRLRPSSDAAGEPNSYDGGKIGTKETELNYFAIRYNK